MHGLGPGRTLARGKAAEGGRRWVHRGWEGSSPGPGWARRVRRIYLSWIHLSICKYISIRVYIGIYIYLCEYIYMYNTLRTNSFTYTFIYIYRQYGLQLQLSQTKTFPSVRTEEGIYLFKHKDYLNKWINIYM